MKNSSKDREGKKCYCDCHIPNDRFITGCCPCNPKQPEQPEWEKRFDREWNYGGWKYFKREEVKAFIAQVREEAVRRPKLGEIINGIGPNKNDKGYLIINVEDYEKQINKAKQEVIREVEKIQYHHSKNDIFWQIFKSEWDKLKTTLSK